jgi:chromodomain-helicase-DNA-binding protein 1
VRHLHVWVVAGTEHILTRVLFVLCLVKWRDLSYTKLTWEDEQTVRAAAPTAINDLQCQLANESLPPRSSRFTGSRPAHSDLVATPSYIQQCGSLHNFQLVGLDWLAKLWAQECNVILADEMGLGETIQGISLMLYLYHERKQFGPFLVVVPLSTLPTSQEQLAKWAPALYTVARTLETGRTEQQYASTSSARPQHRRSMSY